MISELDREQPFGALGWATCAGDTVKQFEATEDAANLSGHELEQLREAGKWASR